MVRRTKIEKKQKSTSTKIERKAKVEVIAVNETQISEAVAWINEKVINNVQGTYLEIGNYIFDNFFGGDLERVRSFNPHKESSFQKLSERDDLLMSKVNLQRAVQVAIQEKRLLPTVSAMKQLTFTHKTLLLPLKNDKKIEELANKAVEENLTTRELQELVKKAKAKQPKSNAGRPELPGFLKSITKTYSVFKKDGSLTGLDAETINKLGKDELTELEEKLNHIISGINQIREALSQAQTPGELA